MLIVDLPIPPGFEPEVDDFAALAASGAIDKYQMTPRSVIVYLRELPPAKALSIAYRLRATMPARVRVAPAVVYEYYTPEKTVASAPVQLNVVDAQ